MFQSIRVVLCVLCAALVAGCGGGSSSGGAAGSTTDPSNPWTGAWRLVSEAGAAGSGQLTLNPGNFSETRSFDGGTCTWTGSVSNVTASKLTITTATAEGAPQCSEAVGRSASPTWAVSDDNNTLTLDYRGAIAFGTLQIWQRT